MSNRKKPIRIPRQRIGIQVRLAEEDDAILQSMVPRYLKGGSKHTARVGWAIQKLNEIKNLGFLNDDGTVAAAG